MDCDKINSTDQWEVSKDGNEEEGEGESEGDEEESQERLLSLKTDISLAHPEGAQPLSPTGAGDFLTWIIHEEDYLEGRDLKGANQASRPGRDKIGY
ncbi:hypothetical protein LR013_05605 [candidate division NPL-UPA2 bacterium]|nr:hypothetical protein [candidate division NPL-UPA2 bacterium]